MNETFPEAAPAPATRRRRTGIGVALGAIGVAAGLAVGLTASGTTVAAGPAASLRPASSGWGGSGWGGSGWGGSGWSGSGGSDPGGALGSGTLGGSSAAGSDATPAEQVGIVDIDSVLGFQNGAAAGTGMVLSADGEVLTNNHVIAGATSIRVTVVSTGAAYPATVVGTDPTDDVAVLHLTGASGLATARFGASPATVGEAVTAVGNAGGTGSLTAVRGSVVALDRSITATDASGGNPEQLHGLIETNAAVEPGDSGGPLYGDDGAIVGMDTAASSGGAVQAYAVPITTAEQIASRIEQGVTSSTIQHGYPAFLGVSVGDGTGGVTVLGVLSGGPAAQAGVTAGDVITAVGGRSVGSAADLSAALASHSPGQRVTLAWTDAEGTAYSATVTLVAGPAR
jgi:S1-C subfamily serine protease